MFKNNLLVFNCLLGMALVSSCAVGEIGDEAGGARLGPESGTFDGGVEPSPEVELSPEAAAEFSEDPIPRVVERSAPAPTNTAMQPEEPIASACSSAAPDLSASNGWRTTQASQAAFDTLRFEFMARPAAANLNGLVAVGGQNIDEFSDAAISVRFTGSGLIDARDGSAYASDTLFAYDPGVWYQISISADITARTYDVAVGRCGEPTQALITGAAFRSDASVSNPLTTWGLWSSQSALIELSTPMWIASGTCAPATCQSLGSECGQPSNGCNGTLSCGGCASGQMCSSGVCIDAPVSPPPPPDCVPATCQSLGSECGQPSNGCNGTLSCGGCASGQMCSSGVCIDAPVSPPPPPDCVPATCQSLGSECGQPSDGCGGTLSCGVCQSGETCVVGGICVAPEPSPTPEPTPPPPSPLPPRVQESTKPTAANTGCNASPYPSEDCDDIPGVPDTDCSDITEAYVTANCPGRICSNFYCKGGVIDIDTSNVTLRNFKHDQDGSLYGIRINEGISNTVIEYGEIWNGDSTIIYDKSTNLIFRYNHLHHAESDFIKADGIDGLYEYNFWEKGGAGVGTHADGVQIKDNSSGNEFRYNNCSMPKAGTPPHEAYPQDTSPPYYAPGPPYRSNACFIIEGSDIWIHHNWMTGGNYTIYGNTTTLVEYNIFGRENGDHPDLDSCTLCTGRARLCNGPFQDWRGNIWEDNGLSAGEGEEDGGTPCD